MNRFQNKNYNNKYFFKADEELAIFNDSKKDKRRNLIMLVIVYLIMTGMIIMDVISRFRSFRKYKETLTKDSKRNFYCLH